MRAAGLVAHSQVEGADLVITVVAHGIEDVDELVVLSSKGVGLLKAAGDIVDAVGSAERQLAVVQQIGALAVVDELPVHGVAAALLGVGSGGLAEDERVPGIIGDVVGAAGGVDLEDVEGAALVGELDADVVAVDVSGPVGDAVGVDVAAEDADGGRVLLVGGDGDGAASGEDDSRDGGSGGGEEAERRAEGRHIVFLERKVFNQVGFVCLFKGVKEVGYFVRKESKECEELFAEELLRMKKEKEIGKEDQEMNLYT